VGMGIKFGITTSLHTRWSYLDAVRSVVIP